MCGLPLTSYFMCRGLQACIICACVQQYACEAGSETTMFDACRVGVCWFSVCSGEVVGQLLYSVASEICDFSRPTASRGHKTIMTAQRGPFAPAGIFCVPVSAACTVKLHYKGKIHR